MRHDRRRDRHPHEERAERAHVAAADLRPERVDPLHELGELARVVELGEEARLDLEGAEELAALGEPDPGRERWRDSTRAASLRGACRFASART